MPESLEVQIDVRHPPDRSDAEARALLADWCRAAGPGVEYAVGQRHSLPTHPDARIDPKCVCRDATYTLPNVLEVMNLY